MVGDAGVQSSSLSDDGARFLDLAVFCDGLNAKRDDFNGASGIGVAVGQGVEAVESGDGSSGPIDAKFEALALVAEVGCARQGRAQAFVAKGGSRFGLEFAVDASDVRAGGREHYGAGEFTTQVGI